MCIWRKKTLVGIAGDVVSGVGRQLQKRSELAEGRRSLTELWPLLRRGSILQVSGLALLRPLQVVGLGGNLLC